MCINFQFCEEQKCDWRFSEDRTFAEYFQNIPGWLLLLWRFNPCFIIFDSVSACPACYHKGSYYAVSSNLYVIFFWFQISLNWEYKINVFQQIKMSKINNRNCGLLCRMCWKWTVNNVWKVCDYGVFFWSILSRTRTEYRDLNITFHILSIHRKIWTRKTPSSYIFT